MLDRNGLVHFLKNTPAISRINFAFESFRIYPTAYTHDVANAISSGKIGIKYANLEDGVAAEYLNNEDVFCFDPGFTIDTTGPYDLWENKGTVIHECTHAYIDIQGIGLNRVIVNESVAYLAESVFVLAMGYNQVEELVATQKRLQKKKSDHDTEAIMSYSEGIARDILSGTYCVSSQDVSQLVSRVARHKGYQTTYYISSGVKGNFGAM